MTTPETPNHRCLSCSVAFILVTPRPRFCGTAESAAAWLSRQWQTSIHPEDLPELLERWQSLLASDKPGEMEARPRRFDGEYRRFLFRTCPLADASGQVVKWCGINTDIDDRKRSEEVFPADESRFRLIVEGLPTLVTVRTPDGDPEFANRHVLEYTGATLDELKGLKTSGAIHPDDCSDLLAAWKEALETASPYVIEVRRRRADGSTGLKTGG